MSANDWLDKLQRNMLDLFFPRHCPFCGRIVGRELLCGTCKASLPYCGEVRTGGFGRCAAPLYYEDAVREAILAFKFKGKLEALDCFGSLMAQTAAEAFSGAFDAVTWAPVSRKRLRQRGYDQARLLCASLCVDWHMKPQETLRKVRTTRRSPAWRTRRPGGPMYWACTRRCARRTSRGSDFCWWTTSSPPARPWASASGC